MPAPLAPSAPSAPWWRTELAYALEIVALVAFAVTQPVLDVFGRSPDVFLFRNASRSDILLFAAVVATLPSLAVVAAVSVTRLAGSRARRAGQVAAVGAGAALLAMQVLKKTLVQLHGVPTVVLATAAAVAFAIAYARTASVPLWMRFVSPAPVFFVALFLLVSPTSRLVFASGVEAADLGRAGSTPPIVMVVFDELPTSSIIDADGAINAGLFPNFARLAATSTWFRDFTTVSNQTWHAIPSLLTGRYPVPEKAPVAADHPENLFTLLGGIYDVRAVETITRLCPDTVCRDRPPAPGGLRRLLRDAARVWQDIQKPTAASRAVSASLVEETAGDVAAGAAAFRPQLDVNAGFAQNVPARVTTFLDGLGTDPDRPHPFDYLHVLLPHEAWRYYPSGMQYAIPPDGVGRVDGGDTWEDDPRAVELGRQRHLLQARYTDVLLGHILDRLEERGVLDRTLVVVVADHGIGFRPGLPARALDEGALAPDTFPELAWAPFFVKAPGQRDGRIDDGNVQLIDVVPTIADLLSVTMPWEVDGTSALADGPRPAKSIAKSTSAAFGPSVEPRVPIDEAALAPLVRERNAADFAAPGAPDLAIYRAGEYGDLVGRPPADLRVGAETAVRATVDGAGAFDAVNLASGTVPGLVTGALSGGRDGVVAIALDGTVAGVSPTFTDRGRAHSFAAILPDSLFRDGTNDLALYLVEGGPEVPVLHPMTIG